MFLLRCAIHARSTRSANFNNKIAPRFAWNYRSWVLTKLPVYRHQFHTFDLSINFVYAFRPDDCQMTCFYYPSNRNTGKLNTEEFTLLGFHDLISIDFRLTPWGLWPPSFIMPNNNIPCEILSPTISLFVYSPKRMTLRSSLLIFFNSRMSMWEPIPTDKIVIPWMSLIFLISFSTSSLFCFKQTLWSVNNTKT